MNKLKKTVASLGAAAALAVGFTGASAVATPDAAEAYNVYITSYTTVCVGPDLWNARWERVDYSFWEEIAYPWPKDYNRLRTISLNQYRNPYCVQRTYA